jgi:hypothetical protein
VEDDAHAEPTSPLPPGDSVLRSRCALRRELAPSCPSITSASQRLVVLLWGGAEVENERGGHDGSGRHASSVSVAQPGSAPEWGSNSPTFRYGATCCSWPPIPL